MVVDSKKDNKEGWNNIFNEYRRTKFSLSKFLNDICDYGSKTLLQCASEKDQIMSKHCANIQLLRDIADHPLIKVIDMD